MVSDSYKTSLIHDDACLEVKGKYVQKKKTEQVQIAVDDELEDDGDSVTVLNIVEAHELNEVTLDKKSLMALIKGLLKKIEAKLKENGKEDRVADFKKGATNMVK